jgi:hypothetical protein
VGNPGWNLTTGIDQRRKGIKDLVVLKTNGANLNDGVAAGVESGRFQIKRDVDALWHGHFPSGSKMANKNRSGDLL